MNAEKECEPKQKALNATAYRIFKLLQWLIEAPLTVENLNDRFIADNRIRKPVSVDSIWFYLNTLKALGCVIQRPSPKNGFQYKMISHPFGLNVSQIQLETLAQAKIAAQQQFTHQEMLALDSLLKKIVSHGELRHSPEMLDQLFSQSRSLDSEACRQRIAELEQALLEECLLTVTYASPLNGEKTFHFLPENLFYRQGVFYIRGERPEVPESSNLRVDRMVNLTFYKDEALRSSLIARQKVKTEVVLKVFSHTPDAFQGFTLDPNQGVYQETRIWVDAPTPYYEVRLLIRDSFYLKQTLLSLGHRFNILAPESFRQDITQTLREMFDFYQTQGVPDHGPR